MAQSAADRRRAQRRLAKNIRENRRTLPKELTNPRASRKAQLAYARDVLDGRQSRPRKGSPGSKVLARVSSWARWGAEDVDSDFYEAFKEYWYKENQE